MSLVDTDATRNPRWIGACVGSTGVVFPDDLYAVTASTSFVVPAACTRVLMTGLVPGAGYTVQRADVTEGRRITLSAGGAQAANALGVVESN